jgi:hypothetical protein
MYKIHIVSKIHAVKLEISPTKGNIQTVAQKFQLNVYILLVVYTYNLYIDKSEV